MSSRRRLANAIRALSMDAIESARSGHPGAPLGMADIAEVLWNDFMRHNPANPDWFNRDRFVLSNGHASMLLYSLLHLSGYDLSIMDGAFVPNITIGPGVITACRKNRGLFFDVRLMIERPSNYIADFIKVGADLVSIHAEADIHLERTVLGP